MTDTEIIIAVARLDGWQVTKSTLINSPVLIKEQKVVDLDWFKYLTSRDAIVPVIEKHFKPTKQIKEVRFSDVLMNELEGYSATTYGDFEIKMMLFATPKQLSIALLKAVGEWRE